MFFESFDKIKIVLKPRFRRAFFDTLAVYKLNVGKFNSLIDYHLMIVQPYLALNSRFR